MSALGCAAALCIAGAHPAFAQSTNPTAQREFDALFQRLLVQPADVATNRRFVEVALSLNDYEAAIGALERLLFYAPEDPGLNVQLGAAYFELGSYTIARSYFESALEFAGSSPLIAEQARAGIEATEQRARPSPWRIYAQGGLRYQSNANVAPDDLDVDVDGGEEATEDFNAFVLSTVSYVRPFGGGQFEAAMTGYYADQFKVERLDLGLVDLIAGPRLNVASGESGPKLSLKPYAIAGVTTLGDDLYRRNLGGGVSVRAELADGLIVEPYFEYRDRRFYESDDYATATDQTGDLFTLAALAAAELGEKARLTSRGGAHRNDAATEDESYDEYFADATLQLRFDPLGDAEAGDWTFAPFGAVSLTRYDAPDDRPADDEDETREDREDLQWRAGARLDIPVAERFGLGTTVQYTVNDSNDQRFDYDNLQVTSGPTFRF